MTFKVTHVLQAFSNAIFWATVCKTVRPMPSDRCLFCIAVLSVLSVTLVYCGQTVGWIKMKLDMQVGLGTGHIVLDEYQLPVSKRSTTPQFSAHIYCGQTAGCINMPLCIKVGLSPGDFLLDGDLSPLP